MAQLDGLRALAVLAVVAHHYGGDYFHKPAEYAASSGVKLFFVLSGFLITGILLRAADSVGEKGRSRLHALWLFYIT